MDKAVLHLLVPELDARTQTPQVVRSVGHRLHPAGNDALRITRADRLRRQHDGFEAGPANFVDRHRRDAAGNPPSHGSLPRRGLALPTLKCVAQDHFFHRTGVDAGPPNRLADNHGADLSRPQPG